MQKKQPDKRNKGVIFKNYASFADCISEINKTQADAAKDLESFMLMYSLFENTNKMRQKMLLQQQDKSLPKVIQRVLK